MFILTKLLSVSILGIMIAITTGLLINLFTSGEPDAYLWGIITLAGATAVLIPTLIARGYIDTTFESMRRMPKNENKDLDDLLRASISHRRIVPLIMIAGITCWLILTVWGTWSTYQASASKKLSAADQDRDLRKRLDFIVQQLCEQSNLTPRADSKSDPICADSPRP